MAIPKRRQEAPADNTAVIELTLTLSTDGSPINNAVGTATVYDETDQVTVGSPLAMGYVAASAGVYHCIAPQATFVVGKKYRCDVVGDVPLGGGHFEYELWAYGIKPDVLPP